MSQAKCSGRYQTRFLTLGKMTVLWMLIPQLCWLMVTLKVWPEGIGLSLGTPSLAVCRYHRTANQGCL